MSDEAIEDGALARMLLEGALASGTKPMLTAEQVETLLALAGVRDTEGNVSYTRASLNRAAAMGWNWKTGLTSDAFEIAAGEGRSLKRQQWFDQCREMARMYGTGEMDVLRGASEAEAAEGAGIGQVIEVRTPFLGSGR
jgi:hypothetical protein